MGYILTVDDEEPIREFIALTLLEEGYQVKTASNGAEALNLIRQELPDLILLDMRMPGMDGWTFARTYRAIPNATAPLIVLTAATDARLSAEQIGADACLPKPFELEDLVQLVARYLKQK